jgi:surface polysaccharide O-acyltransferase-like enzyme
MHKWPGVHDPADGSALHPATATTVTGETPGVPAASQTSAAKPGLVSASRGFQGHIHSMRALAITLIVGAHSVPSFDWDQSPVLGRVIDTICNQASVLFFFIAGYLFQFLSSRFSYGSYLRQKLKTVILPYLLVSIPAIVISVWLIPQQGMWPWFYNLPEWQQVGLFYLTGKHLEPLWFVPTITIFYLAAPLLLKLDKRPQLYVLIIPLIVLSVALGRDGPLGPINKAIYLLPAYLMGMAFSHFRSTAESLSRRYLLVLIGLCAATYAYMLFNEDSASLHLFLKLLAVPVLIVALHRLSPNPGPAVDYVAHVSFGIFFVHAYFISAFRLAYVKLQGGSWTGDGGLFEPSLLGFLVHTAAVLAASVAAIWVVQKLFPGRSRQLIGA